MKLNSETAAVIASVVAALVATVVTLVVWGMKLEHRFDQIRESIDVNHAANKVRWENTERRLDDIERDIDSLVELKFKRGSD